MLVPNRRLSLSSNPSCPHDPRGEHIWGGSTTATLVDTPLTSRRSSASHMLSHPEPTPPAEGHFEEDFVTIPRDFQSWNELGYAESEAGRPISPELHLG
jgi:hypothetical protein